MGELKQPILLPIRGKGGVEMYRLERVWRYRWSHDGQVLRLTVPVGFESDGASVPRLLWTLTGIGPDGLHRAAALAHDYVYHHAGRLPEGACERWHHSGKWEPVVREWTREAADRMFGRLLREAGVGRTRRRLMVLGVRVGGWWPWWRARSGTVE